MARPGSGPAPEPAGRRRRRAPRGRRGRGRPGHRGPWGAAGAAAPAALLVVKQDAHVATALDRDGTVTVQPALRVEVVEPTGAGDAFAGGYLAGLLHGLDQRGRLRLGHLAAACALTSPGDQGRAPDAASAEALLAATEAQWAAHVVRAPEPAGECV
ncbi:carbohydrate kinase family protein [Streptacidiphilus monticola]